MSWVLGGDRSLRRLVIFFFFAMLSYLLVNALAFTIWVVWVLISFLLQACLAPCQSGGFKAFFRSFLEENIYTGFLEWICRWEIRVRNVYELKRYVDPSRPVAVGPYIWRVAFYFVLWKSLESTVFGAINRINITIYHPLYFADVVYNWESPNDFNSTLLNSTLFNDTIVAPSDADDIPYTGVSLAFVTVGVVLGTILVLRILAHIICRVCSVCIDPIFRPRYKYSTTDVVAPPPSSNGKTLRFMHNGYVQFDDSALRVPPTAVHGEDALGLTIRSGATDFYCIPVPDPPELHANKPPPTPIPLLESISVSSPRSSIGPHEEAKRQRLLHTESSRNYARQSSMMTLLEAHELIEVPHRRLVVAPAAKAPNYDPFPASYEAPSYGVYRSVNFDSFKETPANLTGLVKYDVLSPTNRPSQSFQLPRVWRAIDDPTISARSLSTIDPVHFSAFCPPVVSTSVFTFSIWAFLVHQRDEMREEATTRNDDGAKQLSREVLMHVRRGARVHVTLSVPDGFRLLDAATKPLEWDGHVTHVSYNVQGKAIVDGQVLFAASIVLGAQVMRLRSYVFASSKPVKEKQDDDEAGPVEVTASSLEMLPETYEEIAYDELEMKNLVGRGNFGDAYRARYRGQDVVVKTLRPSEFGDNQDQIVQEFRHEAAVLSLFGHHPNIVPFVGACTDLSQPLSLVTEYLPFGSLEDQRSTLSVEQKQQILKGAASGFLNMHEGRFIHRDIAARNCLVDATLNAKVCDFGMCRRVGAVGGSYFAHGTGPLKYMAPESLTPPHAFSYQSDVYSFGVLIWETYHGVSPFAGLSGAEAAARVLSGDRLALSTAIPLHLQDLVTQCFRDDPSKRPSMAQVLMALE
ncbi:serine/threonine protein kinase [Saprolegnia parasitica CBS 223.65]|uniref:Serine/threonine protein kinase n=1 Tax=Saprolegnia parasitica (strain CBS 223.65) TaxID=695850 RepID=A0A067CUU9_SAPPC|nr:serine/threonine protein kinase [Saprolegnia parasitica CBS 223.65]KDO34489.1 serine/threonine protein kinase [Saprolegnia parasitica CBS 223.65]|eukprot:XP_012194168.1 serine/threonine protein kinase [Saprolegnia parasitica CBS 223.65]